MKAVFGGILAATLLTSPAFAESSSGTWNGLSDRFQVDTGYSRLLVSNLGGEITFRGFQAFLSFLF
ncbi:MAG: hypothetical protein EHM91_16490 [Planctomycetota bacterium]|nr:MAG: hypothetical protein EHM91_16490 [Planctomycetota bacterium]